MATVGIWKIQSNLNQVIKYISNEEKTNIDNFLELHKTINYISNDSKTEEKLFVDGINCTKENAIKEMKLAKKIFHKEDGILGFHAYQSFEEGVDPELAHRIGIQLANEIWGDRFQVLVATHLNTNHIHNHFVINSVSFVDGKRYYDNRTSYANIRQVSNDICNEYGLNTLEEKVTRKGINYLNYQNKIINNSNYYKTAKNDLDFAISQANSYNEFIKIMNNMNYEVINRYGKLSIRSSNYKRNIRIERYYGKDYSIENIKKQIDGLYLPENNYYSKYQKDNDIIKSILKANYKGLYRLYIHYMNVLKIYPTYVKKKKIPYSIKKDIQKMDELSREANYLANNNIESDEQLEVLLNKLQKELNILVNKKEFEKININDSKIKIIRDDIKLIKKIIDRKEILKKNIEEFENEKEVILSEHIR